MLLKLAKNLISNNLLVAQDLWEEKEARNTVKVAQSTYGWRRLHLPATGAKVSTRSQAYRQAIELVRCTVYRIVLLNILAHMGLQ